LPKLLSIIADLITKVATPIGEVLREATSDALFLFPTLVLGPHKLGAMSSTVKGEMITRLIYGIGGHWRS
jgi:hypothetical protein